MEKSRKNLEEVQCLLQNIPNDAELILKQKDCMHKYLLMPKAEVSFYKKIKIGLG